jgi:hypothetical protein
LDEADGFVDSTLEVLPDRLGLDGGNLYSLGHFSVLGPLNYKGYGMNFDLFYYFCEEVDHYISFKHSVLCRQVISGRIPGGAAVKEGLIRISNSHKKSGRNVQAPLQSQLTVTFTSQQGNFVPL